MKEELYYLLIKLLSFNEIRVNEGELNLQLLSHPSYPSLHALTGVLNHFSIENIAMQVPANSETLDQLPNTFIAHVVSEQEDFVLVERKKNDFLIHYGENWNEIITKDDFLEVWNGVILVVEKESGIKRVFGANALNRNIWWAFAILLVVFAFLVYESIGVFSLLHFSLSIFGVYLSIAIIKYELGQASSVSNNICTLSDAMSCEAVLNSKGAQLFGFLKLSDVSLITFSTLCLTWVLLFFSGSPNTSELHIVSVLALPFTLYTLYYQYSIVGKWCPLCLGITGVLWLQAFVILLADFEPVVFDIENGLLLLFSFLSSLIIINLLLPIIRRKNNLEKLEIEHYQFKRKFSLFNAMYTNNAPLEMIPQIEGEIVLGDSDEGLELIIVTNPFCYFCKQMHRDLEIFLKNASNSMRVIIRFNVDVEKNERAYRLASILLDIFNVHGPQALWEALQEVYADEVDLTEWIEKQRKPAVSYNQTLNLQSDWCKRNEINFTPVMVVNGRRFPKEYENGDLIYFIEDLIEEIN